jgi:hypothetical protein
VAINEHIEILRQGRQAIHEWKKRNPDGKLDGSHGDLTWAKLAGADLSRTDLRHADFTGADLTGASLEHAWLCYATLAGANLLRAHMRGADLSGANLTEACLRQAHLRGALLQHVDFSDADLRDADLTESNLRGAAFVHAAVDRANLSRAKVFGLSAWDDSLKDAIQCDLEIIPWGPSMTVDDFQLAQFVYLLLQNEKVRNVIDIITSKVVLILGRFAEERKAVLDAIREELRRLNFVPLLFDFDKPASKDITGTVETLARMARFIIADLTDPSSIPHELTTIVPFLRTTPVLPLRLAGSGGYSMFEDFQRAYTWVLKTHEYKDGPSLISALPELIAPADNMADELRSRS